MLFSKIENFSKNILHLCDSEEEAFKLELLEIEKVEATKNSLYYNIASGGKGGVASLWNDLEHSVHNLFYILIFRVF